MAQPRSSRALIDLYATTLSGHASFGNISYRDRVGYSWVQPIVNRLPNGLLVTNRRWSNATAGHISDYKSALINRQGVPLYELAIPHPAEPEHTDNYEWLADVAKQHLDAMRAPRIRNTTRQRELISTLLAVRDYKTHCHLFGKDNNDYSLKVYDLVKTSLGMDEQILVLHSEAVLNGYKTPIAYKGEL
jgi:hypothetical protein